MNTKPIKPISTKQRLLNAGFRAFAERGFHGASIRDICERADANIATANYHFHGKEKLYKAVLEHACQRIRAPRLLPDEQPARQTPGQKLRAGIQSLFQCLSQESDSPWLIRLIVRELAEQSGGPGRWVAAALRTHASRLEEPLREMLGPRASRDCVHLCALNVVSQCVFFCAAQSSLQRLCPEIAKGHASREQLIAHVARFAGAALAHWQEGSAKPGPTKKQPMNKAKR
jgi:AcrR family transcriptional regulator